MGPAMFSLNGLFRIRTTGHYPRPGLSFLTDRVLVPVEVHTEPLVLSASSTYLGGVGEISATYKSESGSYDSNIRALVYIDGSYAGDADLLPRTPPGPGEEDPGQSFTYDIPARNLGGYEVEFIIINDDETASTTTSISVTASPLTSNLDFIKALYLGLFDREPHSSEYKRYFYKLEDGLMTREQVLKDLRERSEFINARNALLAYKTVNGSWAETETVLSATDQAGYHNLLLGGRALAPEYGWGGETVTENPPVASPQMESWKQEIRDRYYR